MDPDMYVVDFGWNFNFRTIACIHKCNPTWWLPTNLILNPWRHFEIDAVAVVSLKKGKRYEYMYRSDKNEQQIFQTILC